MTTTETVILDAPSLLTAAGVVVGLLAAAYASRSAGEARRQADAAERSVHEAKTQSALARASLDEIRAQTRLATHAHRLEIYKAFVAFQSAMNSEGPNFKREATWPMWEHVQVAEFYYPAEIAVALDSALKLSVEIQQSRDYWAEDAILNPGERPALVKKTHDQHENLLDIMRTLDAEMRMQLRVTRE